MNTNLASVRRLLADYRTGVFLVLVGGFFWAYWTTLADLAGGWSDDPQYSHGYLVPAFALLLVWMRRDRVAAGTLHPSWWGVLILLLASAFRLAGAYLFYYWPDRVSVLPILVGLCVAAGGWTALRWTWPALAFLVFMLPLPSQFQEMLAHPLQRVATLTTTYLLQTLGLPAQAEGNVILLSEVELGVVEACSGLRMLVSFFAVATAIVLLLRPPLWQALAIVGSAIPIALACNIARLAVTGVLHETAGREIADAVFHDWAGWLMMPLASALVFLELQLLSRLITVVPAERSATLVHYALGQPEGRAGTRKPDPARRAAVIAAAAGPGRGAPPRRSPKTSRP